jgi:probable HAF family extracellular repeat protein
VGVSDHGAVLSTPAGIRRLGFLPGGARSAATGISPDGAGVVGFSESTQGIRAFRWTARDGMSSLGALPGADSTVAYCASVGAATIGGECFFANGVHGFVWRSGSMVDVNTLLAANGANLSGWLIDSVRGISADGRVITGMAIRGNVREAWIAGVPPVCVSSDFDCDGDAGTDADIQAFFRCLAGNCPASPCTSTADVDADGDVGTDLDIQAFFRIIAGGSC